MNRSEGLKFHLQAVAVIVSICILVLSLGGCKKDADNSSSSVSSPSALSDLTSSTETSATELESANSTSGEVTDTSNTEPIVDNRPKVNVADYGAIVDDGIDDTEAIRSAVYAASAISGETVVTLSSGTYNLNRLAKDATGETDAALYFRNISNVTIQGDDTTLLIGNPYLSCFFVEESSDIAIKGVTIDYSVLPWVEGEIVEINQKQSTFTLKSRTSGKTCLDDPRWNKREHTYGLIRDSEDPRIPSVESGFFYGVSGNCKVLSSGVYQFNIDDENYQSWIGSYIKKGTKVVINNRGSTCGAFRFSCINGDVTIEDCNIYASVGTGFCCGFVDGALTINNCKTMIKPNSGRWMSTNADGVYLDTIKGGLKLTNSVIEGTGDDSLNFYSRGSVIRQIIDLNKIKILCTVLPTVGDSIYVLDHKNGRIRGKATVTEVINNGFFEGDKVLKFATVTLGNEIKGIASGNGNSTADMAVFYSEANSKTIVSNNVIRYNRGCGIKLNQANFEITNNTLEYLIGPGITVYDIPLLYEVGTTTNGLISGNKLKHTAFSLIGMDDKYAQIQIGARTSVMAEGDYGEALGYMHRNLTVKNNSIEGIYRNGIYVSSAENVVLENNTITGASDDSTGKNLTGIVLRNVNNIKLNNNIVNNLNPKMSAGIEILQKCKNVSVSGNKFTLASGVKEIIGQPSS